MPAALAIGFEGFPFSAQRSSFPPLPPTPKAVPSPLPPLSQQTLDFVGFPPPTQEEEKEG